MLVWLGLVLGIGASVVTILAFVLPLLAQGDESASPPSVTSTITSTGERTSGSTTPAPDPGVCLESQQLISCQRPHSVEVIGAGTSCTTSQLVSYLGGSPSVDVLNPDVRVSRGILQGKSVCVLGTPSRQGSARDALLHAGHGGWRWCVNLKRQQVAIACDQRHDAEVVAVVAADGPAPDCFAAAAGYAATSWRALEPSLTARPASLNSKRVCVAEALGDNQLTATIRSIGTQALPIEPRLG